MTSKPAPNPVWEELAALAERTPESADRKLLQGAALLLESCFEALATERAEAQRADATIQEWRKAAQTICELMGNTARHAGAVMLALPSRPPSGAARGSDAKADPWIKAAQSMLSLVTDAARKANAAMPVAPATSAQELLREKPARRTRVRRS